MQHSTQNSIRMISVAYKNSIVRLIFASLLPTVFMIAGNGCIVKRALVENGTIPNLFAPDPAAAQYGKRLYSELISNYRLDFEVRKEYDLLKIFNQLTLAADAEDLPWNVYVFDEPGIVDVRGIHGNYIFVWSGTFDAVDNEDELAGILACELAHVLARHTDPVEFTLTSEVLFSVTELAVTIGLMLASEDIAGVDDIIGMGGQGWMKLAYTEVMDLDSLDRKYSDKYEREAASIALLILSRTNYSPQALADLWKRIAEDKSLRAKFKRMRRGMSPWKRSVMLESLIRELPLEDTTTEPQEMRQ